MLPSKHRIKKNSDFQNVFKSGRFVSGDFLVVKIAKNNLGVARVGFVVGGRVSKKASVRNKIKRLLRFAITGFLSDLSLGVDIVVIVRPGAEGRNMEEIKKELKLTLKKARLIT